MYYEGPNRPVGSRKKPSWGDRSQQRNLANVTLQKPIAHILYIKKYITITIYIIITLYIIIYNNIY